MIKNETGKAERLSNVEFQSRINENGSNDEKQKPFSTSLYVREKFLDLKDLISLMIIEEMRM